MKALKVTENGLIKFGSLDAVSGNVLAKMLEIEHSKMLRTIKQSIKDEKMRKSHAPDLASEKLNFGAIFKEWEYTNSRGRKYNTYIMNEDALYLVIASTQSKKAHELKVMFKSEFNNLRLEREVRESIKAPTTSLHDSLKPLVEELKINYPESSRGAKLYQHIHVKINKAVTGKGTGVNRDKLSETDLIRISELEAGVSLFATSKDEPEATRQRIFEYLKV